MATRRGTWSSLELARLRALFPSTEPARLARVLGRSEGSVLRRGLASCAASARTGAWAEADDERLREALGVHEPRTIARLLGRSVEQVRARIAELSGSCRTGPWTDEEIARLRRLYGTRDPASLAVVLARSEADIAERADALCLRRDKASRPVDAEPLPMPRWTVAEIARLRQLYPRRDSLEVARLLGRSVASVRNKASQLGLGKSAMALTAMGRKNVARRRR